MPATAIWCFTNFVDFDMLYGHRRDVAGYAAALEALDAMLPRFAKLLKPGDLVVMSADHGCDPTWRGNRPYAGTSANIGFRTRSGGPRHRRTHHILRHRRNTGAASELARKWQWQEFLVTGAVKKAELHCHIEGAASPALVKAQARKYNVDVSGFISGDNYIWSDFTEFLVAYDGAAALFRSEEDYALLARTYLEGIAAENAIYAEIFVSPDHAATAGLSPTAYFDGLADGIASAKAATGIECRMIIVGVRHLGASKVEAAAKLASTRPHPLITGFGMAGDERFGKVADFAHAFDTARDAGLGITIHAGELAGPESVRDTLDHIHPARIGHGVRATEDDALVKRIADAGVVLEVCPRLQSGAQCVSGHFQPSVRSPPARRSEGDTEF